MVNPVFVLLWLECFDFIWQVTIFGSKARHLRVKGGNPVFVLLWLECFDFVSLVMICLGWIALLLFLVTITSLRTLCIVGDELIVRLHHLRVKGGNPVFVLLWLECFDFVSLVMICLGWIALLLFLVTITSLRTLCIVGDDLIVRLHHLLEG